jgi:hypothetical protein
MGKERVNRFDAMFPYDRPTESFASLMHQLDFSLSSYSLVLAMYSNTVHEGSNSAIIAGLCDVCYSCHQIV